MAEPLRLSILDQSPVRKNGNARQALQETTELARLADKLGYTRFWVSEHHNTASLAGSAPEVLLAHLGNHTQRIRLGSGGVMLPHYSALKVAENFRLLEALQPGRIDLGIGRAPGGDRLTAALLNPHNNFSPEEFIQQLSDLQNYLTDAHEPGTVQAKVKATPAADTVPPIWVLSSSGESGIYAAHFGMAFSFAQFISPVGAAQSIQMYKERFSPSGQLTSPEANLAIFVLCAETEEKALQLQAVMDVQLLRLEQGMREGFVTYDEIKDYQFTEGELERVRFNRRRSLFGTPDQLKLKITDLAKSCGVQEVVVVTITHDFADRIRSYELLAEAFDLNPA